MGHHIFPLFYKPADPVECGPASLQQSWRLHGAWEQVRVTSKLHRVHIHLLYTDEMLLLLLLLLWLVLGNGVVSSLVVLLVVVATSPTAPAIPPVVRGWSWIAMGVVAPELMSLPTTSTSSTLLVVRGTSCKNLIEVIIFECLSLKDKVGESPADLAKDAASSSRISDSASPIPRGKVGLHCLDEANGLGMSGH